MLIASSGNYSSYQKTEVKKLFRLSKDWSQEQIWITDWVEKVSSNSHEVNKRIKFHPQPSISKINTGTTNVCNLPWDINLSQSILLDAII